MAGKFIILSVTASLLFAAGCSKNRGWLSRKDYSEMQDPFMEPDSAVAKSNTRKSKNSGRAVLDDADSVTADAGEPLAGPKPIRQAAASSVKTENGRRVPAATYPEHEGDGVSESDSVGVRTSPVIKSYTGPELSDFLQKKKSGALTAATDVQELPARTLSVSDPADRRTMNPAATHAALPTIHPQVEDFSNYLEDKSSDDADSTQENAEPTSKASGDANDFVSWAEQQKAKNLELTNNAQPKIVPKSEQLNETASSLFPQAREGNGDSADSMATPEFDGAGSAAARPLIRNQKSESATPLLSKAKPPAANKFTSDESSFTDSFDEFETAANNSSLKPQTSANAARQNTASSKSKSGSLDDSFRIDTGWKPSNLTPP